MTDRAESHRIERERLVAAQKEAALHAEADHRRKLRREALLQARAQYLEESQRQKCELEREWKERLDGLKAFSSGSRSPARSPKKSELMSPTASSAAAAVTSTKPSSRARKRAKRVREAVKREKADWAERERRAEAEFDAQVLAEDQRVEAELQQEAAEAAAARPAEMPPRGMGLDVPSYLRYTGSVRCVPLSAVDLQRRVKEWFSLKTLSQLFRSRFTFDVFFFAR